MHLYLQRDKKARLNLGETEGNELPRGERIERSHKRAD